MANELLGSVDAHRSLAKSAARVNRRKKLRVILETVKGEQDGSCKALVDAKMKEIREGHVRELDVLRNSFEMPESKLSQERDE